MKMFMNTVSSRGLISQLLLIVAAGCVPFLLERVASAAPSVVGLWRFDEGSGTNVLDSSGLGNNGVLAGENGNVPVWVAGQSGFGSALRFTNDVTDHAYVTIPGAASLLIGQTATNAWTITAWAYEDSNGTNDFMANYGRILTIDDGAAFQLESGASGDAELYTWSELNPPGSLAGESARRLRRCWISGCIGRWFTTAPT